MPELIAGMIDVFADAPLTGNPLAVVQGADELSDEQMRRIAGEFNQAETTFILHSARADRKLRSFTASGAEVFGAGHNALGAWLWLGEHGDLGPLATPQTFYQEIGPDVLPIELERIQGRVHGRMRQAPLRLLDPLNDVDPLARSLGLDPVEILLQPVPRPAHTGAAHLLVRVVDPATVDKACPRGAELLAVLKAVQAEVATFTRSTRTRRKRPTPGSSTRPSGSGKTRPQGRRRGRWRLISQAKDSCLTKK